MNIFDGLSYDSFLASLHRVCHSVTTPLTHQVMITASWSGTPCSFVNKYTNISVDLLSRSSGLLKRDA